MPEVPEIPDDMRKMIRRLMGEEELALFEKRHSVIGELVSQTDRGAAIIGGALLEQSLTDYIMSRWRNDQEDALVKSASGKLFHMSGPLGSFSAKIDVAFLAKLIGPKTCVDMRIIKDIRNDFAHKLNLVDGHADAIVSFSTQSIADRCRNLTLVSKNDAYQIINEHVISADSAKNKYLVAVLSLSQQFELSTRHPITSDYLASCLEL